MARLLQKDDWVIYAAVLPALLASGAIGATAVLAWHAESPWHVRAASAVCVGNDDYVEQLAKRGIAKLPVYGPPADDLSPPAAAIAAAAELYARHC
jgi:hypothetical protein